MNNDHPSRRRFLKVSGTALGGTWLGLNMGALLAAASQARANMNESNPWENLSADEARTLMAVADQIYPPDDAPGAAEIGAVRFMDAAFGGFMANALPLVKDGIRGLDERSGEGRFASLDFAAQTRLLGEEEESPFFRVVHFLTLCGVFAMPAHGGNRELEGWKQLGVQARHVWQPPFGYYDAQVLKETNNG